MIGRLTENLSSKIAFNLCESKDSSSEEFEVIKYGVFVSLHVTTAIILTLIFGALTNTLFEMSIISLIGACMKRNSGGVHCSSPDRCVVTGIIVSYIFVLLGKGIVNMNIENYYLIGGIILIHSFIILYKKCPVPSENKPLKKESTRKMLRRNAFLIYSICVILFIINLLLNKHIDLNFLTIYTMLGLYMQTLSLTKMGEKFILLLDKILLNLKI